MVQLELELLGLSYVLKIITYVIKVTILTFVNGIPFSLLLSYLLPSQKITETFDKRNTIHKKDFCSREKYPNLLDIPSNSVFQAGYKYEIHSEIEATIQEIFQFFIFLRAVSVQMRRNQYTHVPQRQTRYEGSPFRPVHISERGRLNPTKMT